MVLRGSNVEFPYKFDEFRTFLRFENQKVHVMIDVEDEAYQYLENSFW